MMDVNDIEIKVEIKEEPLEDQLYFDPAPFLVDVQFKEKSKKTPITNEETRPERIRPILFSNYFADSSPNSLVDYHACNSVSRQQNAGKFECNVCGKYFTRIADLHHHINNHNRIELVNPFKPLNFDVFHLERSRAQEAYSRKNLAVRCHVSEITKRSSHSIKQLSKPFEFVSLYKCEECDKVYNTKHFFKKHLRHHALNKREIDKENLKNGKAYNTRSSANKRLNQLGKVEKTEENQKYGKKRNTEPSFKKHSKHGAHDELENTKENTPLSGLELCAQCFSRKYDLQSENKPNKCEECGKTFTVNFSLKNCLYSLI